MITTDDVDIREIVKGVNIENQDGTLLVSSREVAENFEKRHDNVLKDVDELFLGSPQNLGDLFIESYYTHSQNKQKYREYLMTRDGFTLLAMGFNGKKALAWKLKYIEAFNRMEEEIKKPRRLSAKEELRLHYQVIEEQSEEIADIKNEVSDLKENMPLFNIDCEEIQGIVRKVGIKVLGGYKSTAYDDNSIRGKVYADIQNQLKREFGVKSYKSIKRIQLDQAMEIVKNYKAPLILQERIRIANKQMKIIEGGK